ncbi:MAG: Ig-like domain-containing protein, partial [Desulfosalsimonadaceae bacterium]|nr:Ig-like domain-containing protein [Desulfosalsimonadaceae bacterium]
WSWTTGDAPDTASPKVSSTVPANLVTGVSINKKIAATFSEAMDPLTITTTTFTVTGSGTTPVSGTVTYAGLTATFTPTGNLEYDTVYTTKITSGTEDLAGNAMTSNYLWSFTTGNAPDTTPPTVNFTSPPDGAADVPINRASTAIFSEEMDPLTITTATFKVTGPDETPVSGAVTYVGLTAIFTPSDNFEYDTPYTSMITTRAKDLAGNPMESPYVWSWTTGDAPDDIPPKVRSTDPVDGDTSAAINNKIVATFSEEMDPTTISTATFLMTGPGTALVSGTVTYVGVTATFTPLSNLEYNTTYTAMIYNGAKDMACNPLAGDFAPATDFVWSFTTGFAPDDTPGDVQ